MGGRSFWGFSGWITVELQVYTGGSLAKYVDPGKALNWACPGGKIRWQWIWTASWRGKNSSFLGTDWEEVAGVGFVFELETSAFLDEVLAQSGGHWTSANVY